MIKKVILVFVLNSNHLMMDKNVNPWTGKTKPSRNTGMFNDILYKHYP